MVDNNFAMNDTPFAVEAEIARKIALRSPGERIKMACSMYDSGIQLLRAGVQQKRGPLNEAQLRTYIFLRLYSDSFSPSELTRIIKTIPNMQLDM